MLAVRRNARLCGFPGRLKKSFTLFALLCASAVLTAPALSQDFAQPDGRVPLPMDWSTKHVIYTQGFTPEQADEMRNDPRLYNSWLSQGHGQAIAEGEVKAPAAKRKRAPKSRRDWAFSLGSGTVAQNMYPAKYSFDAGATTLTTANCTSDFAVYGLNVAGSGTQANLVALQNLYSNTSQTGLCTTTGPTVKWAYNVTTLSSPSGTVTTSPVLSLDGTVVMFIESHSGGATLHILRVNPADGGSVASPKTPAQTKTSLGACSAGSCIVNVALGTNSVANSSPFYDYTNDILYVGDDGGVLYKIAGVLLGTPGKSSLSVASTTLTGPVYDSNSKLVFVGGANGVLYAVTASTMTLATHPSIQVGYSGTCSHPNNALIDPPLVDSTNGFVFETATTGADGAHMVVVQAFTTGTNSPTGSSWSAAATADIGYGDDGCNSSGTFPAHSPDFDNSYYTTPASGHLWACGAGSSTSSDSRDLWNIAFSGTPALLSTATECTGCINASNHAQCSPLTEIYNGTDYLYLGEGLASSFGSLYGFTISGTGATAISGSPITYPDATGGTSGIIIDNIAVQAQASSLYFTTLAESTTVCGSSSAFCAVKLTQAALK